MSSVQFLIDLTKFCFWNAPIFKQWSGSSVWSNTCSWETELGAACKPICWDRPTDITDIIFLTAEQTIGSHVNKVTAALLKQAKFCTRGEIVKCTTLVIFKVSSICTSWFATMDGNAKLLCVICLLIINGTSETICSSHKTFIALSSKFPFQTFFALINI